ncbi:MAG TPA: S-4TM family putative pore-forming effector [Gaiellaceae bacterium]|nr:S-4TM family putative pore-forming effector [Gaiellaceae bacterium]
MTPSASIAERQNASSALREARAFRRRYAIARRWRTLRVGVGLLLGTAGIVLAFAVHGATDWVAASAGAWALLSRTWLIREEQRSQDRGARAQEMFDVGLFDLPWNEGLAGERPALEDILNWGRRQRDDGLRNWYPDVSAARPPMDALICQRASLTWARQDHSTYARILRGALTAAFVATVVIGVATHVSLGEYVLRLGLPVLPATLDLLDIAGANEELSRSRGRLERAADRVIDEARASATLPTVGRCRAIQDELYSSRRVAGVPGWLYRLTQRGRQTNMESAALALVASLPSALRTDKTAVPEDL